MTTHTHHFVETYDGLPAMGLDRDTDEKTLMYYFQKFSDDTLMQTLVARLTDEEVEDLYNLVNRVMKNHLSEDEYHKLFLKDASY